jgi:hypothetical protein
MPLALLVFVFASSQAVADTQYFYSGQTCESENNDSALHYSSDGIWNTATPQGVKWVWCPVNGNKNTFVQLSGASISVYNGTGTSVISCRIYIRDYAGTTYLSSILSSYTGFSGYFTLSWSSANMPNGGNPIPSINTYGFYCSVPNNSAGAFFLRGYMVQQVLP